MNLNELARVHAATCAALVALFLAAPLASAQTIDTNRPGFSFTPGVVADGQWQLESGIAWTRFDDDSKMTSLPLAEFRYGVADQVEVFVSSLSFADSSPGGSGLVDLAVGGKVNMSDAADLTQMALLFQVSVPTGDSDFSSDSFDPSLAFVWTHAGSLPLAGTVKVSSFDGDFQFDNGLKLPFAIRDGHSAFVEWEANLPERGGSAHYLNGGYQWLRSDRMQFDLNAGIGLNDRAADYRLGIGFSMQL